VVGDRQGYTGLKFGCLVVCLSLAAACALVKAPVTPDPALLGCYRLESELPASYSDSLGYELPEVIQLGYSRHGQWTVLPTDPDWHPDWTVYDYLPSGWVRVASGVNEAGPMQWDSIKRIPGDSLDVRFPSPLGTLTLRLGEDHGLLSGRSEWVVRVDQYFLNDGARVRATPASCDELKLELRRTRAP